MHQKYTVKTRNAQFKWQGPKLNTMALIISDLFISVGPSFSPSDLIFVWVFYKQLLIFIEAEAGMVSNKPRNYSSILVFIFRKSLYFYMFKK